MDDSQLLRYSRHILLDEIGIEGQQRILDGRALIVGAGGLGSPVALYLASAGVGHITLVDDDSVDLTNLQRQIAHTTARVGQPKTESAKTAMLAINPEVEITTVVARAQGAQLDALVHEADVVFDCTDNFKTRHAINAACVKFKKALVSGAAIRFDGQVGVFVAGSTASGEAAALGRPKQGTAPCTSEAQGEPSAGGREPYEVGDHGGDTPPCYACVFPPDATFEEVACATLGVFAPLVGIIGAMQAAEGLKLLSGAGRSLAGRLLMLDGQAMEWSEIRASRDRACPVCSARG